MKKSYVLIILFLIFIIVFTIIGSVIVTGNTKVSEEVDIFTLQGNREVYFNVYGYTVDNPNVIVNPYGNSPLTAIVMFTTKDYSEVYVTIKSKDDNNDINYSFDKDKYHIIPIYGLYADYDNMVIIKSEGSEKVINIKTDALPMNFEFVHDSVDCNFMFYNGNYPYAVDVNGEIRWYLNKNYYGNITYIDNSSIIIGSDRYDENGNTISFYKMGLLGKIYNEYVLEGGYYGYNTFFDDNVVVLSDKILVIDMQTGDIIEAYVNDNYDYVSVKDDTIVVRKENVFYSVKDDGLEKIEYEIKNDSNSFFDGTLNYNLVPSERFGNLTETITSDKKITLINYDVLDKLENIKIVSEFDRIKVVNNTGDKIYLILDKFMDKRVYEIDDIRYINKNGLSGKYTVYVKISDKIYKTDYYIEV